MKEEKDREKKERAEEKERAGEEKARLKAEKKELKDREKEERAEEKERAGEEKARLKAERKELKERKKKESQEGKPLEAEAREVTPDIMLAAPRVEEVSLEEEKERWFFRLRQGLSKSRLNFVTPLSRAMATSRFDDDFWEEFEDILIGADVGMEMTMELVERTRESMTSKKIKEPEQLLSLFKEVLAGAITTGDRELLFSDSGPSVFIVVGVNGTGKTTTIAKLAYLLRQGDKKVLLAAGDTFRAAGTEQLEVWGDRVGVHTVKHKQGADAAAVVHDAVESAIARGVDVVIVDTAGRLHTKSNLMEELKKIKRVAEREAEVTETLLVIDATTGQNGLIQAREFKEAVEVTGVILTKLDGTARGGIVVAIGNDLGIPIKFIGVGESLEDLHPFDPGEFADALFSKPVSEF